MIQTDQNILKDLFAQEDRKVKISENKKNFYVNNDELLKEVMKCKESGSCSPKLAEMFQKLAYRVSFMPAFRYDTDDDRNDCVQHAVFVMIDKGIPKYEEERKTNTFSFFTEVAMNGLRAGWNEIKKHSNRTVRFDIIFDESI